MLVEIVFVGLCEVMAILMVGDGFMGMGMGEHGIEWCVAIQKMIE